MRGVLPVAAFLLHPPLVGGVGEAPGCAGRELQLARSFVAVSGTLALQGLLSVEASCNLSANQPEFDGRTFDQHGVHVQAAFPDKCMPKGTDHFVDRNGGVAILATDRPAL